MNISRLPLDFRISLGIFQGLNLVSLLLVIFLFVIYAYGRRNRLLRSGCLMCAAVSLCLLVNWIRFDTHVFGGAECTLQAVVLNYAYVSLHGHFCFFMVNSCFSALNWSFLGSKRPELRTTLFIIAAWLIPLLPTAFAVWRFLGTNRPPIILARPFYCAIKSPSWPLFRSWFFCFSGPGLFCSFYLLFRTWRYRQTTLHLSKTTQIDKSELFRLLLAISLYLLLIALSVGSSSRWSSEKLAVKVGRFNIADWENPYRTPQYCITCDPSREYSCAVLCPTLKSYLPVIVGLFLFAMYGFGSVARCFYRRILPFGSQRREQLMCCDSGSRKSSLPQVSMPPRNSLPATLFANSSSSSSSLSSIFSSGNSDSPPSFRIDMSTSSTNRHQHHPTLPSIDEDLEMFYLTGSISGGGVGAVKNSNISNQTCINTTNNKPRQVQRRFSEPLIKR